MPTGAAMGEFIRWEALRDHRREQTARAINAHGWGAPVVCRVGLCDDPADWDWVESYGGDGEYHLPHCDFHFLESARTFSSAVERGSDVSEADRAALSRSTEALYTRRFIGPVSVNWMRDKIMGAEPDG